MFNIIKEWDEWMEDESEPEDKFDDRLSKFKDRYGHLMSHKKDPDVQAHPFQESFCDNIRFIGEDRFNDIIQYLGEVENSHGVAELTVNQEDIDDTDHLFDGLLGWTFIRVCNGEHRHDGELVDYEIAVYNDKGVQVANFSHDMCLMVGWDIRF